MNKFAIVGVFMIFVYNITSADDLPEPDSNEELVKRVWLERRDHLDPSIWPNMCINAQSEYNEVQYTARIIPHNESATVKVDSGPIFLASSHTVIDGSIVKVRCNKAATGEYQISIYKRDAIPDYAKGTIFLFKYRNNVNFNTNAPINMTHLRTDASAGAQEDKIGALCNKPAPATHNPETANVFALYRGQIVTEPDKKYAGRIKCDVMLNAEQSGLIGTAGEFIAISISRPTDASGAELTWRGKIDVDGGGCGMALTDSHYKISYAPHTLYALWDRTDINHKFSIKPKYKQTVLVYNDINTKGSIDISTKGFGITSGYLATAYTGYLPKDTVIGYRMVVDYNWLSGLKPATFSKYEITK